MAKNPLISINNYYRNTKNLLITINDTYRKINKAFITIDGSYRLCYGNIDPIIFDKHISFAYSSQVYTNIGVTDSYMIHNFTTGSDRHASQYTYATDELCTTKQINNLSVIRHEVGTTTLNGHAIFAGGFYASDYINPPTANPYDYVEYSTVETFDNSLTKSIRTSLSSARGWIKSACIGNYALFAGGHIRNWSNGTWINDADSSTVDAFNKSFTRSIATSLNEPTHVGTGISTSKYALFIGGAHDGGYRISPYIFAYNSSLTKTTMSSLPNTMSSNYMNSVMFVDKACFWLSSNSSDSNLMYTCNDSLTLSTTSIIGIHGAIKLGNLLLITKTNTCTYIDSNFTENSLSCETYPSYMHGRTFSKNTWGGVVEGDDIYIYRLKEE